MECQACRSQLTALLDHELSVEAAGLTRAHLETCDFCREEFESLRFSADLVDRLPAEELALPAWSSIRERALPAPATVLPFQWDSLFRGSWAAAAAAVLTLALSLGLLVPTSTERLRLAQSLEEYVQQRRSDEALLETAWGLIDEGDLPNPFSLAQANPINPFLSE